MVGNGKGFGVGGVVQEEDVECPLLPGVTPLPPVMANSLPNLNWVDIGAPSLAVHDPGLLGIVLLARDLKVMGVGVLVPLLPTCVRLLFPGLS